MLLRRTVASPSPDRPAALAVGMACGAACAAWLDPERVVAGWMVVASVLVASAGISGAGVMTVAIPHYVARRDGEDRPFEAAYRAFVKACTRHAGTVVSAVVLLATVGLGGHLHRSEQAESLLRLVAASHAGVLACDLATILLTLAAFLAATPREAGRDA